MERLKVIQKVENGKWIINEYNCKDCLAVGIEHKIENVPGPSTGNDSHWGPGFATTLRKCSACGRTDGPWVSSDDVGDGWEMKSKKHSSLV